jgi:ribosomal protein S18 acetylase RimI-like enzyme
MSIAPAASPIDIRYRPARAADLDRARGLMRRHGPTPQNYLPVECIEEKTHAVAEGRMRAVVALDADEVVGILIYSGRVVYPQHVAAGLDHGQVAYVEECVVRRDLARCGVGKRLLAEALVHLDALGVVEVYADSDESNLGTLTAIRQAGFEAVETVFDPERRSTGARRTTISRRRRPVERSC